MDFSEPIRRALEALGDKNRRNIVISLEPPNKLTYSEIAELLKKDVASKGTVTYHIHKLESAGLISNYVEFSQGRREHSYYRATSLCISLVNSILNVYEGSSVVGPQQHPLDSEISGSSINSIYLNVNDSLASSSEKEVLAQKQLL